MQIHPDVVAAIGRTPLIRLRRASEQTGCEILGKAEFMNPGGSVKDRAALYIVKDAEERGLLRPGGVIVEGTAGNTGIGLALVANARGYRTVMATINGQLRPLPVRDQHVAAEVAAAEKADPGQPGQVAAPFQGAVTVLVAEGDTVAAGDTVATIEAMKMEAAITAPKAGTIERLAIAGTQQVDGGDLLLVIA